MKTLRYIFGFVVIYIQLIGICGFNLNIALDMSETKPLERFWTSTGFSPTPSFGNISEFLLSKDQELNLALISSVPNNGITHVRIHWLLDLISAICKENEPWMFNFTDLDKFLSKLYEYKLSVGFELMGNPSNCFQNWKTQSNQWENFIHQLIQRYIGLFGYKYISSWRIETLNEPDLKMFNRNNMSLTEYISYVNATSHALHGFQLKLWGPAGLFKNKTNHPLCWGLLEYCETHQCPIDVLSFHKKGNEVTSNVVNETEELINKIKEKFHISAKLPMANDESDPSVGWIKPKLWRQDVRYAASVAQIVIDQVISKERYNYTIEAISNDNAFLSYYPHFWTQRTLLARFQMNNTLPHHVQMFQKPVFAVMTLLSKLGPQLIEVKRIDEFGKKSCISFISSADGDRRTILVTINNDNMTNNASMDKTTDLVLNISYTKSGESGRLVMYELNNFDSNPEKIWNDAGKPNFPDKNLRRRMRENENPSIVQFEVNINQTETTIIKAFPTPTVLLFDLCYQDKKEDGVIQNFKYISISNSEILLTWDDSNINRICVKTFLVEIRKKKWSRFKRITNYNFITTSYHFDGCILNRKGICKYSDLIGEYRVGVVDYWNKTSHYSDSIYIGKTPLTTFTLGAF